MEKIYFFEEQSEPMLGEYGINVAFIITEESLEELISHEIINDNLKYIELSLDDYYNNESPNDSYVEKLYYLDYLKFDENNNLIWKLDKVKEDFLSSIRAERQRKFKHLDQIAVRALSQKREDIVEKVEVDKQKLRDLTQTIDFDSLIAPKDIVTKFPPELSVDYIYKYEDEFKTDNQT